MGLCKCPKKKVTNLFCFEHRVNVCEHCLIDNHNSCVVQSYLSWLADSDYDKNCSFCTFPLENGETVRLKCLHLFHWECLDGWARSLPAKTAPAGYKCRICGEMIFPAPNQTSPAIEKLRLYLQRANWARAGLGLALLPDLNENGTTNPSISISSASNHHIQEQQQQDSWSQRPVVHHTNDDCLNDGVRSSTPDTVLNVGDDFTQQTQIQFFARKSHGTGDTTPLICSSDRDEDLPENKYKRRSAGEWFNRWIKSRYGQSSRIEKRSSSKLVMCKILLLLLLMLTICALLLRIAGRPADDDPAFDPLANPQIHIAVPQQ